jgi:hypothetical protein
MSARTSLLLLLLGSRAVIPYVVVALRQPNKDSYDTGSCYTAMLCFLSWVVSRRRAPGKLLPIDENPLILLGQTRLSAVFLTVNNYYYVNHLG